MTDKDYTIKFNKNKDFAKSEAENAITNGNLNEIQTRLQHGFEQVYNEQNENDVQEHISDLAGWLMIEWAIDGITLDEGRFMDEIFNAWFDYYDPTPEDEERFHDWFWTCTALASAKLDKIKWQ